ncbi:MULTISPECIES: hypothetical protein [Calothrix]|uniref:Uncharacterized protein n=2 Tax=Calothrix TaxID=1186 RepID=A0ABR8A904_9CYAN|nr:MULTISPECIES: hypothetical protein [Calothrix]MBD2196472.1 hypothetical protein [Calothrix parietina FACHB-288]MBD2224633.1 hypothetical protein [Calothrix anomala FACHB-343]
MMIDSENKLLSIDESCLSELSDENQATISGGTFLLLGLLLKKKWWKWHPAPQPPVHKPYEPPHPHH